MNASTRVRALWREFEQWVANVPRAAVENNIQTKFKEFDSQYMTARPASRPSKEEHERKKVKLRRELENEMIALVREEWAKRMETAKLSDEDWGQMSEREQPTTSMVPYIEPPPSLSASSSEYSFVSPLSLVLDDEIEEHGFESISALDTIDRSRPRVPASQTHSLASSVASVFESARSPSSASAWSSPSPSPSPYGIWSVSAATSLQSSREPSQSGSPEQISKPMPLFDAPPHSRRPPAPTSTGTSRAGGSGSAGPRYIGPELVGSDSETDDEAFYHAPAITTKPVNGKGRGKDKAPASSSDNAAPLTLLSMSEAEAEADFERFKMATRAAKIREFHIEAAELDVQLAETLYGLRSGAAHEKEEEGRRIAEHEGKMYALRRAKEEERKELVKVERARRRAVLKEHSERERAQKLEEEVRKKVEESRKKDEDDLRRREAEVRKREEELKKREEEARAKEEKAKAKPAPIPATPVQTAAAGKKNNKKLTKTQQQAQVQAQAQAESLRERLEGEVEARLKAEKAKQEEKEREDKLRAEKALAEKERMEAAKRKPRRSSNATTLSDATDSSKRSVKTASSPPKNAELDPLMPGGFDFGSSDSPSTSSRPMSVASTAPSLSSRPLSVASSISATSYRPDPQPQPQLWVPSDSAIPATPVVAKKLPSLVDNFDYDSEPSDEWKRTRQAKIAQGFASMVDAARVQFEAALAAIRHPQSSAAYQRAKDECVAEWKKSTENINRFANEEYLRAVDEERVTRKLMRGTMNASPVTMFKQNALVEEQQAILAAIQRDGALQPQTKKLESQATLRPGRAAAMAALAALNADTSTPTPEAQKQQVEIPPETPRPRTRAASVSVTGKSSLALPTGASSTMKSAKSGSAVPATISKTSQISGKLDTVSPTVLPQASGVSKASQQAQTIKTSVSTLPEPPKISPAKPTFASAKSAPVVAKLSTPATVGAVKPMSSASKAAAESAKLAQASKPAVISSASKQAQQGVASKQAPPKTAVSTTSSSLPSSKSASSTSSSASASKTSLASPPVTTATSRTAPVEIETPGASSSRTTLEQMHRPLLHKSLGSSGMGMGMGMAPPPPVPSGKEVWSSSSASAAAAKTLKASGKPADKPATQPPSKVSSRQPSSAAPPKAQSQGKGKKKATVEEVSDDESSEQDVLPHDSRYIFEPKPIAGGPQQVADLEMMAAAAEEESSLAILDGRGNKTQGRAKGKGKGKAASVSGEPELTEDEFAEFVMGATQDLRRR
ncbi:hypothetical protein MIND_01358500 [Mycena indigotica]|uniref:Uncharacterized protein n=1 Tax=Mycena indigotica TaxID=2126181 RepID=A0A8H6S0L3_9AGAR|nr:uncharacterized protein MIND_01358500 [Mycena indigotica]KAF7289841.1 hypothetical protein MIND_01358500 [Mycena indigotica]